MEDGLSQSNEIAGERDRESQLETIERATEEIWRYKIWSYLDILYTKKTDGQTELFLKLLLRLKRETRERQERDKRENQTT